MKVIILLLGFICALQVTSLSAQNSQNTNGLADYWDPTEEELFRIFKKEYREKAKIDHVYEATQHTLLVKLDSDDPRIVALENKGKTALAKKYRDELQTRNKEVVEAMNANYPGDQVFYYYSADANDVFNGGNLSKLYSDLVTPAENVTIETIAYVLLYTTPKINRDKQFLLYIYDQNAIQRVGRKGVMKYKSLLSGQPDYTKSIVHICNDMIKRMEER